MKRHLRLELKKNIKLKLLAEKAGITQVYLSQIINNRIKPSQDLASKLAKLSNQMMFTDKFKPEDFLK
jgi:transcriptional regulator with XRE-family HTH domain|tara:strand:- start:496 stop:699 length:204 start_codon:yes stop_codon:yes gene_type:complete